MENKNNVVCYAGKNRNFNEMELDAMQNYADKNGIEELWWNTSNQSFKELVEESIKDGTNQIIVYSPDRISRNMHEYIYWKYELAKNSIKLVSITEQDNPESKLMEAIIIGMVAYQCRAEANAPIESDFENGAEE